MSIASNHGSGANWFIDSTNNVWINEARKAPTNPWDDAEAVTYLTSSNVTSMTATMTDTAGVAVTNVGTITFSYIGTNGRWTGTIPYNAALVAGTQYSYQRKE